jgi:hypothetical protein
MSGSSAMIWPVVWCTPSQVTDWRMTGTAMAGGAGGSGSGGAAVVTTIDCEPHGDDPAQPVREMLIWSPSSTTPTVPHWSRPGW